MGNVRDRHVVLPPEVAKLLPKNRLLSEVRKIRVLQFLSILIPFLFVIVLLFGF